MKHYFQAERLKYRHTCMGRFVVSMPLISVVLSAWLTHVYFAIDSYNWWYMVLYPATIGIVCGMIGGKDAKKKNHTIWSLPCSMGKIWDAKILVGVAASSITMLCMVAFTIAIGEMMKHFLHITFIIQPSVKAQLIAGLVIWLTTLWQVPFCLLLSQKLGRFILLLVHFGSYAVASIIFSLQSWYMLFPGAITSRLMCPVLNVLPNGLPAVEGEMTYHPELLEMQNLLIGIPAAILWFVFLWWVSRKWFERKVTV